MSVCIVGWGHTAFGNRTKDDVESLTLEAARAALADAGIEPADIDEIVVGSHGGSRKFRRHPAAAPSRVRSRKCSAAQHDRGMNFGDRFAVAQPGGLRRKFSLKRHRRKVAPLESVSMREADGLRRTRYALGRAAPRNSPARAFADAAQAPGIVPVVRVPGLASGPAAAFRPGTRSRPVSRG